MSDGTLVSAPPDAASEVFDCRLSTARVYAERLADDGVRRGLIGPREVARLWERHLLNCAVLGELIPHGANVVDIGSGAGLPGIPLAIVRPDLTITLIEPMQRRTEWLSEMVAELGLSAKVVRGRAEERAVRARTPLADVVTSRAVAPLDRLAAWSLPLTRPGGIVLALKGANANVEIEQHREAVARLGGGEPSVRLCGAKVLAQPTRAVRIERVGSGRTGSQNRKRTRRSR